MPNAAAAQIAGCRRSSETAHAACGMLRPTAQNAEDYAARVADFNRRPPKQVFEEILRQLVAKYFPQVQRFDFDRLYSGIPLDDLNY